MDNGRYQRKQVYEGGKIEGSNITYKEVLSGNIEDVKQIKAERRIKIDRLNELKNRER